jgi:hypothetical protein
MAEGRLSWSYGRSRDLTLITAEVQLRSAECVLEDSPEVHMTVLIQSDCQWNNRRHQRAEQDGDRSTVIQGFDEDSKTGSRAKHLDELVSPFVSPSRILT